MAEPFILRAEQRIPRPLDEVFEFFSRAENLERITPPWLNFRIRSVQPSPIKEGTLIRYTLHWRIFPIWWTTRIEMWEPPYRFVDLQLRGPYSLWHHEHRFQAIPGGTLMNDEVRYRLPFGALGRLVHGLLVRQEVESIFDYRRQAVEDVFGCWPST